MTLCFSLPTPVPQSDIAQVPDAIRALKYRCSLVEA
jgi:hypothetical protein